MINAHATPCTITPDRADDGRCRKGVANERVTSTRALKFGHAHLLPDIEMMQLAADAQNPEQRSEGSCETGNKHGPLVAEIGSEQNGAVIEGDGRSPRQDRDDERVGQHRPEAPQPPNERMYDRPQQKHRREHHHCDDRQ